MKQIKDLSIEELNQITGGKVLNPSCLTEEALEIAKELGEGKDMGSWKTMSGEEFLLWWRSSQKENI